MTDRDPGFETDNLLLATIDTRGVADQPRWSWTRVLEEIRSLPGVESASLSSHRPLGRVGARNVEIRVPANATRSVFNVSIAPRVTAGHFDTLGIPLSGTDFGLDASEKREIVVNEVLAELVWPEEDPVGRYLRLPMEDRDHRVVAVSKNRNCLSVLDAPTPCLYQTIDYLPMRSAVLVLRMSGPPLSISSTLRERIRRVDPAVVLYDVRSMHAHLTELLSGPRLIAFLSRSLSYDHARARGRWRIRTDVLHSRPDHETHRHPHGARRRLSPIACSVGETGTSRNLHRGLRLDLRSRSRRTDTSPASSLA